MKEFTQINWHAILKEEAAVLLESDPASGLTQAEPRRGCGSLARTR